MTMNNLPERKEPNLFQLIESQKVQIEKALPRHLNADRMIRIAMTELRKTPKLAECDRASFIGAIIQASQLGLEPGNALGHAYLVPFWNKARRCHEVQLIPGYRGLIDLARRSGKVVSISARVVRAKDEFRYVLGSEERIEHVPSSDPEPGEITHVYAIARLTDGTQQMEVMTRAQVDTLSKNPDADGPWKSHYDEMARKTVIRRLAKYLPLSPEYVQAIELDDQAYRGEPQAALLEAAASVGIEPDPEPEQKPSITQQIATEMDEARRPDLVSLCQSLIRSVAKLGVPLDRIAAHLRLEPVVLLQLDQLSVTKLEAIAEALGELERAQRQAALEEFASP